MRNPPKRPRPALAVETLEARELLSAAPTLTPVLSETFDHTAVGKLPAGWSQTGGAGKFAVTSHAGTAGSSGLRSTAGSGQSARAWANASQPANVRASADVFVDSLVPAQVFVRGSQLSTSKATYYAVSVTRGLDVRLVRSVNGSAVTLDRLKSASYLSGQWVTVSLQADGNDLQVFVQRRDNGQYLNSKGVWQKTAAAALDVKDSSVKAGGQAGLMRAAGYAGKVTFDNFSVARVGSSSGGTSAGDGTHTTVSGQTAGGSASRGSTAPNIPQHYNWIRIAELGYTGTTIGSFEQNLLRHSVDLVIPSTNILSDLNAVAPQTPNLIYTNVSSLYRELLTDWLNYADAHHVSRESAFYHVTTPTRFSGKSSSSMPVNWFWGVYLDGQGPGFTDVTYAAHSSSRSVPFAGTGTSVYLAYPDRFREINVNLATGARSGWSGVLEYPTAVDSRGNPTAWATLKTLTDTTKGLTRSGQITFDPPANWVTASVNGSDRMYYVRFRTVSDGTAPLANTILGRNYTNSHDGGWSGTIPVFDSAADKNHDGYLNDAEYGVALHAGMTARFAYESRLFPESYGPMRPAANPSSPAFRQWAVDYDVRLLKASPLADGLFVDNSSGKPPADNGDVRESVSTYGQDYGAMLNAVGKAIAPKFLLANTSGGQTVADPVISQNSGYFEEFALRPLAQNWQQFEDLANLVTHRSELRNPAPYAVLDSLATGGSPTDPRTQVATLAEYYMMADPKTTFLDFYGGQEPATSWSRHWSKAATYNVGQPLGTWSLVTTGHDPGNSSLAYHVYQRKYTNALVLYKPLSHSQGVRSDGKLGSNTATVMRLNGTYRPLRADGTLGNPVTSISLRNGEGAILVPVTGGHD